VHTGNEVSHAVQDADAKNAALGIEYKPASLVRKKWRYVRLAALVQGWSLSLCRLEYEADIGAQG